MVGASDVALSAIAVVLLLFNGWMGWSMVYRGHVGVADDRELVRVKARS